MMILNLLFKFTNQVHFGLSTTLKEPTTTLPLQLLNSWLQSTFQVEAEAATCSKTMITDIKLIMEVYSLTFCFNLSKYQIESYAG